MFSENLPHIPSQGVPLKLSTITMPDWQKYGLMSGKNSTLASIQVIFTKKAKISVCKKTKKKHPEHLMQPEVLKNLLFGSD
jgi:hypothetical protein